MGRSFKAVDEITKSDVAGFVVLDPEAPGFIRPVSLADDYEGALSLALPETVPAIVSTYWDATRMLWLYGWFYCPFYSMATVHANFAVELALKERFRTESIKLSRKNSTLERMLEIAVEREWLVPEQFSNFKRRRQREREWEATRAAIQEVDPDFFASPSTPPVDRKAELVGAMKRHLETLRRLRNDRAHPDGLYVVVPGMTYSEIEYARDLIAQLFAVAASAPGLEEKDG